MIKRRNVRCDKHGPDTYSRTHPHTHTQSSDQISRDPWQPLNPKSPGRKQTRVCVSSLVHARVCLCTCECDPSSGAAHRQSHLEAEDRHNSSVPLITNRCVLISVVSNYWMITPNAQCVPAYFSDETAAACCVKVQHENKSKKKLLNRLKHWAVSKHCPISTS